MKAMNRRQFMKTSMMAATATALGAWSSATDCGSLRLSFSTLGCPQWDFDTIVDFASKHGYSGIEFRGLMGELDLTRCKEFSRSGIAVSKQKLADKGLTIPALGSSVHLHDAAGKERRRQLDDARKYIDLAHALDASFIRVFPDRIPQGQEKARVLDRIIEGLHELNDHAAAAGVGLLLESHGDFVKMDDLHYIMQHAFTPHTGLIWDICNMWAVTKETPADVFNKLSPYIRHVHLKDAIVADNTLRYVLMGKGNVPICSALQQLNQANYSGFHSVEWEKWWHADIEGPEIALAQYPAALNNCLAR